MAAPITHILLALQILQSSLLPFHDTAKFIRGTSFPDIRYLVGMDREITHPKNICWADVENETNSFMAGFYFHVFVDDVRVKLLEETELYINLQKNTLHLCYAVKLAEDRLLYDVCNKQEWEQICSYFDTIDQEAIDFGVSKEDMHTWQQRIKMHCFAKICDEYINNIICYPATKKNNEIKQTLKTLKNNERFEQLVITFYDNFIELIHCYKNASPVPALLV